MYVAYDPLNETERVIVDDLNSMIDDRGDAAARTRSAVLDAVEVETTDGEPEGLSLDEFLENVGNGWVFIELAVAHFAPDEEFGFEELSNKTGEPVETLKAYHRNLGRTARSLDGDISDVIPSRWDVSRVLYRIPPELHAAATT